MKRNIKLPTLLGVIILVIGLISGIFLINSTQEFKLSANIEAVPKNVRFSNITDTSITVSWTTDIESVGLIKWGTNQNTIKDISNDEINIKSYVHSANISGINNSNIFLIINSDGKDYDNDGIPWQTKTNQNKINSANSITATGTISSQDNTASNKTLVYISAGGILMSTLTSDEGSYIIPISKYLNELPETNVVEINVQAGIKGVSQAIIYPKNLKSIPTILIGKTYDFRSLSTSDTNENPKSSLSIPESIEVSSRFEIAKTEYQFSETVTLESINNGEIIQTNDPDFFGKGPKDTNIEISVESELQSDILITDSKGNWNWSPPKNLEAGEHTVTLKWRDSKGILRTIIRNFIVSASEGPAFESTPSATPLIVPIASESPSPILKTATPKSTSTPQPVPETGSLFPTIGLFIMGAGILLSSYYIWNKSADIYIE